MVNGNEGLTGAEKLNRKADEARAEKCSKEIQKVLNDHRCTILPRVEIIGNQIVRTGVMVQVTNPTRTMVVPAHGSIGKPRG